MCHQWCPHYRGSTVYRPDGIGTGLADDLITMQMAKGLIAIEMSRCGQDKTGRKQRVGQWFDHDGDEAGID